MPVKNPTNIIMSEILTRIVLIIILALSHFLIHPYKKIIHPEEWWHYMNPVNNNKIKESVPNGEIAVILLILPALSFLFAFCSNKSYLNRYRIKSENKSIEPCHRNFHWNDLMDGCFSYSLSLLLTAVITEFVKISVGRPRPDFFNRCFPSVDLRGGTENFYFYFCFTHNNFLFLDLINHWDSM